MKARSKSEVSMRMLRVQKSSYMGSKAIYKSLTTKQGEVEKAPYRCSLMLSSLSFMYKIVKKRGRFQPF